MIGRLEGSVVEREEDGSLLLDVNGVGYEVFIPARCLRLLPAPPEKTTLYIHTHVREEALTLYGFADRADRFAFRTLLGVSGVGPKLALSILNHLTASDLALAVAREDKNRFKGISGVGKKVAERLLIDLRDKLSHAISTAQTGSREVATGPIGPSDKAATAVSALVQMGFSRAEAERAVSESTGREGELTLEELLREALSKLA
ncbi:MAG: Holliday junction branch migration protein RuvA [Deltaproteobacteria bacterium]|nr:Holliday junction branch migration protein RuvA [Deltaproteobacteria bacterium]